MMAFATDRDLLTYEPNIFQEVGYVAQQMLSTNDGVLSGTSLTSVSSSFPNASIDEGSVVVVADEAVEVIRAISHEEIEVSRLRKHLDDPPIGCGQGTGLTVTAATFGPQIGAVHDGLMALLGCDEENQRIVFEEERVLSISVMARLETLGALERIYSGAIMLGENREVIELKANRYRRMFAEARSRASVKIDVNGDGHADEQRSLGLIRFMRA